MSTVAVQPVAAWKGKNIVICCDGTGNEFSSPNPESPKDKQYGRNSNVVKLYTTLEVDQQQVAYYHPGVGTMGAPTANYWISKKWTQIKGLAFGAGFRNNVLDAYSYLMENYNDNGGHGQEDRVFLFGFSRGSYTVRALAGLLHGYGLLCRGNEGHMPYAWRAYVNQHTGEQRKQDGKLRQMVTPDDSFKQTFSHQRFKIHFLGVFDTVSSVGWISTPLRLFSVARNDVIQHVRHAVSIDEHRCFFMDNLFADNETKQKNDPPITTDVVQAWFAGVHSDVGGSYPQPESGLAYESLKWMLAEAEDLDLKINQQIKAQVLGWSDKGAVYYKPPDSWQMHKSLKGMWALLELLPHRYYSLDGEKERKRIPLGFRLRQIPKGALVHASVWNRLQKAAAQKKQTQHGQLDREETKYARPYPGAQPYRPRNCLIGDLVQASDHARAKDGTTYWKYLPAKLTRRNWLEKFLDHYALTWLVVAIDVFVVLPGLLLLVSAALGVASLLVIKAALLAAGLTEAVRSQWPRFWSLMTTGWHWLAQVWTHIFVWWHVAMRRLGAWLSI